MHVLLAVHALHKHDTILFDTEGRDDVDHLQEVLVLVIIVTSTGCCLIGCDLNVVECGCGEEVDAILGVQVSFAIRATSEVWVRPFRNEK